MIRRLTDEHTAIVNAMGELRRAATACDMLTSTAAGQTLEALLHPHTAAEEKGLFAELRLDSEFTAHIDALCAEHRTIDHLAARVSRGELSAAGELETLLRRHIEKEENGVFPAAAVALDGAAWDRVETRAS